MKVPSPGAINCPRTSGSPLAATPTRTTDQDVAPYHRFHPRGRGSLYLCQLRTSRQARTHQGGLTTSHAWRDGVGQSRLPVVQPTRSRLLAWRRSRGVRALLKVPCVLRPREQRLCNRDFLRSASAGLESGQERAALWSGGLQSIPSRISRRPLFPHDAVPRRDARPSRLRAPDQLARAARATPEKETIIPDRPWNGCVKSHPTQ